MGNRGNAGLRFLITLVVVGFALVLEYVFTSGGVLRWLTSMDAPRAPPVPAAAEAPAPASSPPARKPEPRKAAPRARVTAPASAPEFAPLPLANSFEDGDAGWAYDARGGDGLGARSMDTAYNGHFALYSQASEPANRGWPGWLGTARYRITPGRTYVFRAVASSPDGGNAWLDIGLYDAAGNWLGGRSTGCSRERPGRDWQRYELRYVADDPRVASVGLGLLHCLNHTRGRATTVYFDDVRFE